jgi:putative nucleotidyltransferase with HDIG domain
MENKTDRRRTRGKDTLIKKEVEELIKYGCDDYIIQHGLLVMNISDKIAKALKRVGADIDEKSILRGAILHDIGRSKEHSVRHGFLGGKILKKDRYDRKVIKIAGKTVRNLDYLKEILYPHRWKKRLFA